ncbi:MAG: HK97 family phage prohead protease [Brachymonas denitrificans]
MTAPSIERRAVTGLQASGRTLTGYAAVFNQEARIADFVEVIAPGAFAKSLADGRDILALADHDTRAVLGRTKSGTLALHEDSHGLAFSLRLPDTQHGRDLAALAARGDLGGMSFAFESRTEEWRGNTRELIDVELHEISVIAAHPAYSGTSVNLRHREPQVMIFNMNARNWLGTC